MIVMKHITIISLLAGLLFAAALQSCIEDGFTGSSADQPEFSVDTLHMGVIFTEEVSTTHRFTVYNRANKGLSISKISLSGPNASLFRLNVDGFSGREFADVEIRANDSIFVMVETTLPANERMVPVEVDASLDFLTNGLTRSVTLSALGRDVTRLKAVTLTADTRLTADKPYQIFDSLVVSPGVTLTVDPAAELYFHDGASMVVRGTLKARGETDREITLSGDRTGNVVTDISFDIMSRQWQGVFFTATSRDNELSHACVRNTWQGVTVNGSDAADGEVSLLMVNTRLRNAGYRVLESYHADIRAYGCEFAEAADGPVLLHGGTATLNQCTLANYYLFSAISGPLLTLSHVDAKTDDESGRPYLQADITNTILYGLGTDLSHGDLSGTSVMLRNCLLKSEGTDDDNFTSCQWGADPLFLTVRDDYYFDYRVAADSPAIGAADPALVAPESAVDRLGTPRGINPTLGAYQYVEEQTR